MTHELSPETQACLGELRVVERGDFLQNPTPETVMRMAGIVGEGAMCLLRRDEGARGGVYYLRDYASPSMPAEHRVPPIEPELYNIPKLFVDLGIGVDLRCSSFRGKDFRGEGPIVTWKLSVPEDRLRAKQSDRSVTEWDFSALQKGENILGIAGAEGDLGQKYARALPPAASLLTYLLDRSPVQKRAVE